MSDAFAHLPYRRGVGVMLLNARGEVFVARRIDTTAEAWQMPQGGIDAGEDPETAALRELEEETGLKPEHVQMLARAPGWLTYDLPAELVPVLWKGKYRGQEQAWFALRLVADERAINIATEHPEFSEWKWLPMQQLPEVIVPFKRAMYQQIVRAFESLVA
jgi:putative (di)nucleoside polyphosphate hydrolase